MIPILQSIVHKKFKGGALQLAITIALLIFLLLGAFLLKKQLSGYLLSQVDQEKQLEANITSSLNLLKTKESVSIPDSSLVHLFPATGDSTFIVLKPWGLFNFGIIETHIRNQSLRSVFLFGNKLPAINKLPSLYFSSAEGYLSIAGTTYLGNNTYLPTYGVRKAYYNGTGYLRKKYVFGNQYKAATSLPTIANWVSERLENCFSLSFPSINFQEFTPDNNQIKQSFYQPTLLLESKDRLNLSGLKLTGNIMIYSQDTIIADSSTTIDQCVLIAKVIKLKNNFKGRGQFIASERIEVGPSCKLLMPSIVAVSGSDTQTELDLSSNVTIDGTVLVSGELRKKEASVYIPQNCTINGQVYSNTYSELHGTINGSFYTPGFIYKTQTSFNRNFLLNVNIDSENLPEGFCGLNLVNNYLSLSPVDVLF